MTMAAVIGNELAANRCDQPARAIRERIEIFDDFRAVEQEWRALESSGQTATPYQRFNLVDAWQDHVGVSLGAKPLPVLARDSREAAGHAAAAG